MHLLKTSEDLTQIKPNQTFRTDPGTSSMNVRRSHHPRLDMAAKVMTTLGLAWFSLGVIKMAFVSSSPNFVDLPVRFIGDVVEKLLF